jgi:hypothetical protein
VKSKYPRINAGLYGSCIKVVKNMEKQEKRSIILPEWRRRLLEQHLLTALITLELVLSVIFLLIAYLTGNIYFKGVGIGLVIAWVTSGIAYLFKKKMVKS